MNIIFSVFSFQNHFLSYDRNDRPIYRDGKISVIRGKLFEIDDLSPIIDEMFQEKLKSPNLLTLKVREKNSKVRDITEAVLNRILHPVGLVATLCNWDPNMKIFYNYSANKEFSLATSKNYLIEILPLNICTQSDELFRMMLVNRITTLKLRRGQCLQFTDVTKEELFGRTLAKKISTILDARCPKGYICCIEGNQRFHATLSSKPYNHLDKWMFSFTNRKKGMRLSLYPKVISYSRSKFREELLSYGEISIMPNQKLSLPWPGLMGFVEKAANKKELKSFSRFLFDYLFLIEGYQVYTTSLGTELTQIFAENESILTFVNTTGFSLSLEKLEASMPVIINLEDLAQSMIEANQFTLSLQPGQRLEIYRFEEEELGKLHMLSGYEEFEPVLKNLLLSYCPEEYEWEISPDLSHLDFELHTKEKERNEEIIPIPIISIHPGEQKSITLSLHKK